MVRLANTGELSGILDEVSFQRLLTRDQVAKVLNVSPRTVDYWRKRKGGAALPFVKHGYVVRFLPRDVKEFIERHRVGA